MASLVPWLRANSSAIQPDARIARRAMRHLTGIERRKLYSPDIEHMRTAEGRWYEAMIYERFLDIAARSDAIRAIALKGADAPRKRRAITLGQNGIFYSRLGDITVRGNGQDLAEFDLLMVDGNGQIAFGEVVTSPSDMKEFEMEIQYKKRLLGYLFDQKSVPFLLISSLDISQYSVVRRLMKAHDNINIHTNSCEEIKAVMHASPRQPPERFEPHESCIRATDLSIRMPFEYRKYHDGERNRIFSGIANREDIRNSTVNGETGQLVKKVLYGSLYPSAVKKLCNEREIIVRGRIYSYKDLQQDFSKVVFATDLPDYDPIVYLRSRHKKEYFKMVQNREGNFKFERSTPSRVGFFLWLESLPPTLGSRITGLLLDAFSPGSVGQV